MTLDQVDAYSYPTELQRPEYVSHLARQFETKIELLNGQEIADIVGPIAKSRNSLFIVRFGESEIAVLKQFRGNYYQSPHGRARKELDTLNSLTQKGFANVLTPLSSRIVEDIDHHPLIALRYVQDLYPASSLGPSIAAEATGEVSKTTTLDSIFKTLSEYHRFYTHEDSHLGNFGIKQGRAMPGISCLIMDLESSEAIDTPSSDNWPTRERDLSYLVSDIMAKAIKNYGLEVLESDFSALRSSVGENYLKILGDNINLDYFFSEAATEAEDMVERTDSPTY